MDLSRARAAACAALLAQALGCSLLDEPAPEAEDDEQPATDPAAYAEEVDDKLRRHSACRDTVASVVSESWERYTDQVGDDGKPKRRREGVFLRGIPSNTFRGCRRVLADRSDAAQMPVIEGSTAALVDAATRYAELTRELDAYADAEGWKADDWATLATVDPELRAAYEAWSEADAVVQRALDLRHVENDQILLGVLERRASPLEFAARRVMIYARPLVRCLERDPPPTVDDCRPLFEAFDGVEGEFEELYAGDPATADRVFWMSTFAKDVEEFHEVAGDLVRKLGQRRLRTADIHQLRESYSSLVRDAETLDFDFP